MVLFVLMVAMAALTSLGTTSPSVEGEGEEEGEEY
jgi:hypothetical protein